MLLKAMALKRLASNSLPYRHHHLLMAGYHLPSVHSHALWNPSMHEHGITSAPCLARRIEHFSAKVWHLFLPTSLTKGMHGLSHTAHASNSCYVDDEVGDTSDYHECEDREILGAATALHDYMQKDLNLSPEDAAAVVEGAPCFVRNLVAVTKQESEGEADAATTRIEFSEKVHAYLKGGGSNLLEPVLESIGAKGECLTDLVAQLSAQKLQTIFSLIKVFEKLGVPRSSLRIMVSEDAQVLLCTEDEIVAGFHVLKGLIASEDEVLSLIHRYPLILKSEAISNISLIYDELEEFTSRDDIIRRAVCKFPQHVHKYRKGCAREVVHYLRSYNFTVYRLDQMLQKHARLILTDVEKRLKQNVQFLEDLGGSKDLVYKVINRCPTFLFYSLEENLETKLKYFKELGLDELEFCHVLHRFPNLFSASLENKVKPAVEELRTLGLSDNGLKKVVLYRPSLFCYKLGGDISALVKQLNQSNYAEDMKVTAFIKLYSRGTEHKQKCEDCLVQHGLSVAEAMEVLEKEPGILGYNEHVLNYKLETLKTFGIPIQTVLKVPEYLCFALRKRVQRRERVLSYMKSKRLFTEGVTLKQLVLHSNTHFYNQLVKPHLDDKELCKIWYRRRDVSYPATSSISSGTNTEAQLSTEA
ncbi:hypothetical protein L7F22_014941 [Adiantum nelumboides]|nr:hypothetical protein [Adiantum nelumboides]